MFGEKEETASRRRKSAEAGSHFPAFAIDGGGLGFWLCLSPDEKIVGRLAFYKHSCLMQDVSDPCGPLFSVKEGDMESLNASNRSRTLSIALGIPFLDPHAFHCLTFDLIPRKSLKTCEAVLCWWPGTSTPDYSPLQDVNDSTHESSTAVRAWVNHRASPIFLTRARHPPRDSRHPPPNNMPRKLGMRIGMSPSSSPYPFFSSSVTS